MECAFSVFLMIAGAFVGLFVRRWDSWREIASHGDLTGEWLSVSHGGDHEIVRDKLIISRKHGKIHIINSENTHGYSYECYCTLSMDNILTGKWHSLRKGSKLRGQFLLLVNPQGTAMSGFYSGKRTDGTDLLLGWIIARDEAALEANLDRLPTVVGFPKLATDTDKLQRK